LGQITLLATSLQPLFGTASTAAAASATTVMLINVTGQLYAASSGIDKYLTL
jgi:hypothetical protein